MDKNALVETIVAAFPEDYPARVDLELRRDNPHPEEQAAARLFLGKRWIEIPATTLLSQVPSPFLIGATSFQYYLPAFLIAALVKPESGLADYLVEFSLLPPKRADKFAAFANRFGELSQKQRAAVASFLLYVRNTTHRQVKTSEKTKSAPHTRAARRIDDAITRFWRPKE